jgi:inositol-phosphate phosphatase/L-galactose 1-phosphate phosphatase/histidinol-phosphatase
MSGNAAGKACPEPYIELAERLAEAARGIVLPYFRAPLDVERKADDSPVTAADRDAEAAMRAMIAAAFPEHGVVGEEFGAERVEAEFVWILDPIDGTKRFITGHTQFGTLIALLHRGEPILGVIDMPVLEERWTGAAGQATLHRDRRGTREAHVRPCAGLDDAVLYATTPHMFPGADFGAFERVRTRVKQPMYGGECYAYGLLASGYVDLVIEATMGVYDFLPLVPVVTGAGGVMTDWAGAPLGLHSDGRVAAAGDAGCHAAALEFLDTG